MLQVQAVASLGTSATAYTGVGQAATNVPFCAYVQYTNALCPTPCAAACRFKQ